MQRRIGSWAVVGTMAGAALAPTAWAGTVDQQQPPGPIPTTVSVAGPAADVGQLAYAQTFTAGVDGPLDLVELRVAGDNVSEAALVAQLRTVDGGGAPTTTVLSEVILPPVAGAEPEAVRALAFTAFVTAGTRYAVVLRASGADTYFVRRVAGDAYAGGAALSSTAAAADGGWTASADDLVFTSFVHRGAVERFTTAGCSTTTLPPGVQRVRAWATGGAGGSTFGRPGGRGDGLAATIPTGPGGALHVCVGTGGGSADADVGRGGGASGVALGTDFSAVRLVAGAGGGSGAFAPGGDAGMPSGAAGGGDPATAGQGGTATAGGAAGTFTPGATAGGASGPAGPGTGGNAGGGGGGGGGGAGFFGGGGSGFQNGGGGGGSSACVPPPAATDCTRYPLQGPAPAAGAGPGGGQVTLLYTVPGAPAVQVVAPLAGASYAPGEAVTTSFTCAEGSDGPGLVSCLDGAGRPSGAPLDTATAGDKVLTVTATSSNGLTTSRQVAYVVRAPAGGAGGPGGAGPGTTPPPGALPPQATPPVLAALRQTRTRWARSGRARAGRPVGTTFSFVLDRPATVVLTFTRELAGRRSRGRCVAPAARLRRAPRCTRSVRAGTLRRGARAGTTRLAFRGALGRTRRLAPGRYRLDVVAQDAAGRSSVRRLRFTVLR